MTHACVPNDGRSRASALEADVGAGLDRLRAAWKQRRSYRRTLAALRELPPRMLTDLDFPRGDLGAIAHHAVYGR